MSNLLGWLLINFAELLVRNHARSREGHRLPDNQAKLHAYEIFERLDRLVADHHRLEEGEIPALRFSLGVPPVRVREKKYTYVA